MPGYTIPHARLIIMTQGDEHDCGCGIDEDRRRFVQGCGAAMAFATAGTSLGTVAAESGGDVESLLDGLPDNWGEWGENDELGALNLLGSKEAFDGMTAARQHGRKRMERFSLQLSMTGEVINPDPDQPDVIFPNGDADWPSTDNGDPAFPPRTPARRDNTTASGGTELAGGVKYVDDTFVTSAFLQGTTHLDALGHAWYGNKIYNGFSADTTEASKEFETTLEGTQGTDAVPEDDGNESLASVDKTRGLERADVSNPASSGLVGRAVLLDIGRHLDVADENDRLPLGYGITYDDLIATAEAQGTEVRERDMLLVRTGAVERTRDSEAEWGPLSEPGLVFSEELVEWVAEREIPYIGADNLAIEKAVQEIDGNTYVIPLHAAFLRNLGVYLNEILWLQELAEACAADGIYEFLFTGAPLNIERGSGAPINPVVVKATGN